MYLTNIQQQLEHSFVWNLFPNPPEEGRILFRAETDRTLIQSPIAPIHCGGQTKMYNPEVQAGATYIFRIRVHPIIRNNRKTIGYAEPSEWLAQREDRIGARFEVQSSDFEYVYYKNKQATIATAIVSGLLEVHDASLLKGAIASGIGRAKAAGCGLLSMAPVPLV